MAKKDKTIPKNAHAEIDEQISEGLIAMGYTPRVQFDKRAEVADRVTHHDPEPGRYYQVHAHGMLISRAFFSKTLGWVCEPKPLLESLPQVTSSRGGTWVKIEPTHYKEI